MGEWDINRYRSQLAQQVFTGNVVIVAVCLLLVGCTDKKEKIIQRFPSYQSTTYSVHVFASNENNIAIGKELTLFQNSNSVLQDGFIIQLWDLALEKKRIIALGITNFPTYLILNKNGIELETQDIQTVKRYLINHLM